MKKLVSLVLAIMMVLSLAACSGSEQASRGEGEQTEQEKALAEAASMSWDDLLAKAKEEIGSDALTLYGTISEPAALTELWKEKTGIEITWTKLGDAEMYTKVEAELSGNGTSADMIITQDSYSLATTLVDPGYVLNYFPEEYASVIDEASREPMALLYLAKVFMYNNTDGRTNYLYNVWQLAGSEADADHIFGVAFKSPTSEQVNMNFLVMLTSDAWCEKLAAAYEAYYGKAYEAESEYKNIGYKWIAEFIGNTVSPSSETDAAKGAASSAEAGSACFVPMSKFRNLKADPGVGNESAANLTVAALEGLVGFGGFMYAQYVLPLYNTAHPYTAALFIDFLLSVDGYAAGWGSVIGYYSSNSEAPYVTSNGNQPISFWTEKCVVEDIRVLVENYTDVYKYVLSRESN